jgi:NADPH-dependent curcumin reductase CurA
MRTAGHARPYRVHGSRRGRGDFLVADHGHLWDRFVAEMSGWLRSSEVRFDETVVEGLENVPDAFLGLQRGENLGKMLVRL